MSAHTNFSRPVHYLRGIAIILIVTGHVGGLGNWPKDTVTCQTLINLITGGTSLYVFISGFLFERIYAEKFSWPKFMYKKLLYVGLPYLICSMVMTAATLLIHPEELYRNWPTQNIFGIFSLNLLIGKASGPYWYIPFAFLLFALSPLFLKYLTWSKRTQIITLILTLLISSVMQRSGHNINIFQALIYFLPLYLLGMSYSQNETLLTPLLEKKWAYFLVSTVALAWIAAKFQGEFGVPWKEHFFDWNGVTIKLLEKSALIIGLLNLLQRYRNKELPVLDMLARCSFGIYFLHMLVKLVICHVFGWQGFGRHGGYFQAIFTGIAFTAITLLLVLLLKKLMGRYSRYVIGC